MTPFFLGDQRNSLRSSAEAEYRVLAQATCEVVWLLDLLKDFGVEIKKAIPLYWDNKAAVYITSNATFHERTKHIEIDCHTIRDRCLQGLIKPLHIKGEMQLADIFTKALPVPGFLKILSKMGLHNIFSPHLEGSKLCEERK